MVLDGLELEKYFPFIREIPYRTFYNMPKRFETVPEFFSIYFNYRSIRVEDFVNLFVSSTEKYEKVAVESEKKVVEILHKVKELHNKYWSNLSNEEKIVLGFALLHTYLASWGYYGIYEILIDCPPPGFYIESRVSKEKLKVLEKIKDNCTKVYEGEDIYGIIIKIMESLRDIVYKSPELVKSEYLNELREILGFENFYEMMQNSVLQLLY